MAPDNASTTFKRTYPSLFALVEKIKKNATNSYWGLEFESNINETLPEEAVRHYGSLAAMPTGYWLATSTFEAYFFLIRYSHKEHTQSLIQKILTDSVLASYISIKEQLSSILSRASTETLANFLQNNGAALQVIAKNPALSAELWKQLQDGEKALLIDHFSKQEKLLPSIGDFDFLEKILHFTKKLDKKIIAELTNENGKEFRRLISELSNFETIIQHFPAQKSTFIQAAKKQAGGLLYLCDYLFEVARIMRTYPDYNAELISILLNPVSGAFKKLIQRPCDFDFVIQLFPDEEENLIDMAENTGVLVKLTGGKEFIDFCTSNLPLAKKILNRQKKALSSIFYTHSACAFKLRTLIEVFPEYHEIFEAIVVKRMAMPDVRRYICSMGNLAVMTSNFPKLRDELMTIYFDSESEKRFYDLSEAIRNHPEYMRTIWSYIKGCPRLYKEYIKSGKDHLTIENLYQKTIDICGKQIARDDHQTRRRMYIPMLQRVRLESYKKRLSLVFRDGGTSDTGSVNPKTVLPSRFEYLSQINNGELVLNTCSHSTKLNLNGILSDGILYPKKDSNATGLSNGTDLRRGDDALVFTAPFSTYSGDTIYFSIPRLCGLSKQFNNGTNVVFKFYDWSAAFGELNIQLTDDLTLSANFEVEFRGDEIYPTLMRFQFMRSGQKIESAEVTFPAAIGMYYGYEGLNNFLRYFIFRIIEGLPHGHSDLKNEIYDSFGKLTPKELHDKLTRIAQKILPFSELNFTGKVLLDQSMINSIQIENNKIDFEVIRGIIKKGDIQALHKILQDSFVYSKLSKSFFLVDGLAQYAKDCGEPRISLFLERTFHEVLQLQYINKRLNSILSMPHELLDHVYTILSEPYPTTENTALHEAEETHEGQIVHRPNHGTVHTLTVTALIPFVLRLLVDYGHERYSSEAKNLDCNKLMKASLFLVTGRKNENGFTENKEEYLQFRRASGEIFRHYFDGRSDYTEEELERYMQSIIACGDPTNDDIIHIVLNLARTATQGRTCQHSTMQGYKQFITNFFKHEYKEPATCAILQYATRIHDAVGDRIFVSLSNVTSQRKNRIPNVFVRLSQRDQFDSLAEKLARVPEPLLPCLEGHSPEVLPVVDSIANTALPEFIEPEMLTISDSAQKLLHDMLWDAENKTTLFYYRPHNDAVNFAQSLSNYGKKIPVSIFETLKSRYPNWQSRPNNPLPTIIATIQQDPPPGASATSVRLASPNS